MKTLIQNQILALSDGPFERGGLVLSDGKVVEIPNRSSEPSAGYQPDQMELLEVIDDATATWHSHPDATANLSVEDWQTYLQWPQLLHAISGTDGIRWYKVQGKAVVNV